MVDEIIRSQPFQPIRLTNNDDYLIEPRPKPNLKDKYLVNHLDDNDPIELAAGNHQGCGGLVEKNDFGENKHQFICGSCDLKVSFPHSIINYGDLRKYFNKILDQKS